MRNVIVTKNVPQAIGPYSVAIQTDSLVFCSGQLGLNPATGDFAADDVAGQTRQALTNLKHVLEAAGSSLEKVVKTTVFLRDMADFPKMNAVYAEFFSANLPARSAIAAAALPKGGVVEIEAIALR
ncbi:MAG: reactive intermediate/imine deaminase [Anaerolineae bacterium CG_4_9_14_3_um_filter_57_17]|nr:reactive intermediate/imine deaminase [bacterium]NCT21389.1 reactive intermediate/imine deaminase [bacterium]OIO83736.1 MAG: reactive intermediate/imine deaminase [Anaerolineae bacterium CG2_30_57_67]PJB66775.1 MAG: reactive intermediate/imine deaminase [Anaerolineae bacterium CG_4_9_14_3_um_filter_57_17]